MLTKADCEKLKELGMGQEIKKGMWAYSTDPPHKKYLESHDMYYSPAYYYKIPDVQELMEFIGELIVKKYNKHSLTVCLELDIAKQTYRSIIKDWGYGDGEHILKIGEDADTAIRALMNLCEKLGGEK